MLSRRKKLVSFAALSTLALTGFLGCGSQQQAAKPGVQVGASPTNLVVQAPPQGQLPAADLSGIPANALSAILGTYKGQVTVSGATQDYTLTIARATIAQQQQAGTQSGYAYATFQTSSMSFSTLMQPGLIGYFNGNGQYLYTFSSTQQANVPQISQYGVGLIVALSLQNGTQVDPAQSKIFITDCGLSFDGTCSEPASQVAFGPSVSKQ